MNWESCGVEEELIEEGYRQGLESWSIDLGNKVLQVFADTVVVDTVTHLSLWNRANGSGIPSPSVALFLRSSPRPPDSTIQGYRPTQLCRPSFPSRARKRVAL
jgi:hypothetical protein